MGLKEFLHQRWLRFHDQCNHRPLLITVLADGTPVKCLRKVVAQLDSENTVQAAGRRCSEFFLVRGLALYEDSLGRVRSTSVCREPLSTHRKDNWTCYSMIDSVIPLSRELGHRGIITTVGVMDGGLHSHQFRRMRQRHDNWYRRHPRPFEVAHLEKLDWNGAIGCKAHPAHNSIAWGMRSQYQNEKEDLKHIWLAIEAVLNNMDSVLEHLTDLLTTIEWVAPPINEDQISQWWSMLGYKPALVTALVELNLWWNQATRRLQVNVSCRDQPYVMHKIYSCLLGVHHVHNFIENRWASFTKAARPLIGSIAVGLDFVMEKVKDDPDAGHEFIGAWKHLNPHLRIIVTSYLEN